MADPPAKRAKTQSAAAADGDSAHLELLSAMVSAQTKGERAVQAVVESALRDIGCAVEQVVYTPMGTTLKSEFAHESTIARGERLAVVGRWGGSRGEHGKRSLIMFAHPDGEDPEAAPEGAAPSHWTASRPPFQMTVEPPMSEEAGRRAFGWCVRLDLPPNTPLTHLDAFQGHCG